MIFKERETEIGGVEVYQSTWPTQGSIYDSCQQHSSRAKPQNHLRQDFQLKKLFPIILLRAIPGLEPNLVRSIHLGANGYWP